VKPVWGNMVFRPRRIHPDNAEDQRHITNQPKASVMLLPAPMCAKSAKGRMHPGDAENQRRITKASVVLLLAPHVREVPAKSVRRRIHPGDAENQRRITKVSVKLLPAPH
jgi:hypothetical protein